MNKKEILLYQNRRYAMGEPTYDILKERKSIIDDGLIQNVLLKKNEILPIHLGASPQT